MHEGEAKGIVSKTPSGLFFEEYPSGTPSRVLNGHIFTLLGIYDLWKSSGREDIKDAFLSGVRAFESLRPLYRKYILWTNYDLYLGGRTASLKYHLLNLKLMGIVRRLSKEVRKNS